MQDRKTNRDLNHRNSIYRRQLSFLSGFSESEWHLNGHKKKDIKGILQNFQALLPYIKKGRCLELGCGTGILAKFIYLFSKNKIVPFGIDNDCGKIKLAKKHNPRYKNNFSVADYYSVDVKEFKDFSTIILFLEKNKYLLNKQKKMILSLIKFAKKCNIIVFCYEAIPFNPVDQENRKFLASVYKLHRISFCPDRFFVISLL